MAWLTTDWEKELNQVEDKVVSVLDEKVEPLMDRVVAKASAEMSTVVSQASFELQDTAKNLCSDLRVQRKEMVDDMKSLIRYAALMAFLVVLASVVVITLARLI